ncbi:MAG: PEP-CTERM sorting domain-containing protein [Oscillatoria sp. SIO1A7]|nr:PEP-CTERM sorting domain-containing protein [Oscillatoria sp. SIO1A7]
MDDELELNVNDDFSNINGNFAFYNSSQNLVRYSGFQAEPLPAQDVPEPASSLGLLALGAFGMLTRLKKKQTQK